jgi:hypothetical protein
MTELRNVALILFCAIASGLAQTPPQPAPTPSVVYSVQNPAAIKDYRTNPRIVREMVNRLVLAATGQSDGESMGFTVSPRTEWESKFRSRRRTFHDASRHRECDCRRLAAADIHVAALLSGPLSEESKSRVPAVSRWLPAKGDRTARRIRSKAVLSALFGKLIWGDLEYFCDAGKMLPLSDTENTSNVSHFSKIVSTEVDKVINVPVMSISETNGIAGCIYNMTIPNIDNWRRFAQGSRLARKAWRKSMQSIIAKKVVFNLMDGLIAQYAGGPQPQPNYAIHHGRCMQAGPSGFGCNRVEVF